MPAQKNPLLRLVVPIVVAAVGVVIVVAGYRNATVNPKTQPLPGSQAPATTPAASVGPLSAELVRRCDGRPRDARQRSIC